MGLYFFDAINGVEFIRDEVGSHHPDREAAREHAQKMLGTFAQRLLPDGQRRDFVVDVKDSHCILIYTCTLSLSGRWLDFTLPPTGDRGSLMSS